MERAIEFNSNDRKLILNLIKRTKSAITKQNKKHSGVINFAATDFAVEVNLSYGQKECLWMKGMDGRVYWGLCCKTKFHPNDTDDAIGAKLGFADKAVNSNAILYKVMDSIMDRERERTQMEGLGFTYSPYGGVKSLLYGKMMGGVKSRLYGKMMKWEKNEECKEVTFCRFFNSSTLKNKLWCKFEYPDLEGIRTSGIETSSTSLDEVLPLEDFVQTRDEVLPVADLPKIFLGMVREFVHQNFMNLYMLPDKVRDMLLSREDI